MSKFLITGAAGFIGYHLILNLVNEGHEVIGIDNINNYYDVKLKHARLKQLGIAIDDTGMTTCIDGQPASLVPFGHYLESASNSNFKFLRLDIKNKEPLLNFFKVNDFEYVVHLAAQAGIRYSLENPDAYIESNLTGFFNILECCRKHPVTQLLFASSSSVYGNNKKVPYSEEDKTDSPISLYAATKKSNELLAHSYSHLYKIPITGLRFFTVYGPWGRPDMAPMLFTDAIKKNQEIKVFNDGNMVRDFTFIDDIIEGVFGILFSNNEKMTEPGKCELYNIFNIGNSSPVKLLDFISQLEETIGSKANKKMVSAQPGDVYKTWSDTTKINSLTGFKAAVNLQDGVRQFIEWHNTYYPQLKAKESTKIDLQACVHQPGYFY